MAQRIELSTAGIATAATASPLYLSDMQSGLSGVSQVASDLLPILGVVIAGGQIMWFVYSKLVKGKQDAAPPKSNISFVRPTDEATPTHVK